MDVENIIREYIEKSLHMSLATSSNNRPWVCEVHFVYDDDLNLYWRSLASRRHSLEIANTPQVAGNIVRQHAFGEYPHAIYFEGTAAVVDDAEEQKRIFPLFQARLGIDDSALAEAKKTDGCKFYKVTVENWFAFGKFGSDSGNKLQLAWHGGKQ